jgi:hypothetical protein
MNVSFAEFAHVLNAVALDDSSLALLALLAGMAGGWTLTGWRERLLARREKAATAATERNP